MTTLDQQSMQAKLEKLAAAIDILDGLKDTDQELFVRDARTNSAAMFNLVICIELIVDIGNHILNASFNKPLHTYKDVITELGKQQVVPAKLSEQNATMADFRNMLIHAYPEISLTEVYKHLQKAPGTFRQFARHFHQFIDQAT